MAFALAHYSANDWAILLLGIVLGLLAAGGPSRDRCLAEDERAARLDAERVHEARINAANQCIAEPERAAAPAIDAGTAGAVAAAAGGTRNDLALIRGVDRSGETRLNEMGVHRYHAITRLLEGRLGLAAGTIAREAWREQAALLARDKRGEQRARYR